LQLLTYLLPLIDRSEQLCALLDRRQNDLAAARLPQFSGDILWPIDDDVRLRSQHSTKHIRLHSDQQRGHKDDDRHANCDSAYDEQ
jgi:hypothetical protein